MFNEVKVKKEEAEEKIKELDLKIEEIKAGIIPTDPAEKKAEADDLLAQAMALVVVISDLAMLTIGMVNSPKP